MYDLSHLYERVRESKKMASLLKTDPSLPLPFCDQLILRSGIFCTPDSSKIEIFLFLGYTNQEPQQNFGNSFPKNSNCR